MKKIFCFLCVLSILCLSFLSVTASAATYADTQNMKDLLSAPTYTYYAYADPDDMYYHHIEDFKYSKPFWDTPETEFGKIPATDLKEMIISFKPFNQCLTDHLYIFLSYAGAESITFKVNGSSVIAHYSGSTGKYYAYYLTFNRTVVTDIEVRWVDDTHFYDNPGIISCFTSAAYSRTFNTGHVSIDGYFYDKYDLDYSAVYRENLLYSDLEYVPADFGYQPGLSYVNVYNDTYYVLTQGRVHLYFNLRDEVIIDSANYATFTMMVAGPVGDCSAYVSSATAEDYGDPVSVPVSSYYGDFGYDILYGPPVDYEAYGYTLFVDLNGVNIRENQFLHIEFSLDPVPWDNDVDNTFIYWWLTSASYSINTSFDLTPSIIVNNMFALLDQVELIGTDVNRIYFKLVEVLNALTASSSQQQEVQNQQQSMQGQSTTIDNMNQVLSSVQKTDPSYINGLVGNLTTFDNNALAVTGAIANNKYVSAILTIVFTLALVGYILFGKR